MAEFTEEQLNSLAFQKKQIETQQLHDIARNRLEALRITKDIMIENQRNSSIEDRSQMTVDDLIAGAETLTSFVHNPEDFK